MNSNTTITITENRLKTTLSIPWLRLLVHFIGLLPMAEMLYKLIANQLTVNPIQFVEQFFGRAALNMLVVTLAVTPIVTITGLKKLSKHRRTLGLYTFMY
ncbi:hypothetical protein EG832_09285, partial [bacterium]|nr:hypothetical protein [bacterium]